MIKKFYLKFLMGLLLMAFAVPHAQSETLTVANGTTTNAYVPIHSTYWDTQGTISQVVYPASMLTDMVGKKITAIKFYTNSDGVKFSNGTMQISLGEVASNPLTVSTSNPISSGFTNELTAVLTTGAPTTGITEFTLLFTEPFQYNGGELVFESKVITAGTWGYTYFYGESTTSGYNSFGRNQTYRFLPKTTFTYEAGTVEDYAAKVTDPSNNILDFGTVPPGSSLTKNVTLKNTGANAITPTSVIASGTGFSTSYTPVEIASNATVTIPIEFNPTSAGNYSGVLAITFPSSTDIEPIEVALSGTSANNLTVCDGSNTNDFLPIYGYYYDSKQINQMIYPASMLTAMVGKKIKSLTFYTSNEYFSGGKYNVSIGTTTQTVFASPITRLTGLTVVASDQVGVSGAQEVLINFDEPFEYNGNNLVIDFEVTTTGSYGSSRTYFKGVDQETATSFNSYGSSINSYGVYGTNNTRNFLPMVKFELEDDATPSTDPTITVSPATLNAFTTEVGTAVTQTVTVTGANLTGDITVAASGDGFSVSPTTIAAADAANGVQVTVTYNPRAAGNHTGTLTLSSDGATSKTVTLNGTATLPPTPTIAASVSELAMNAVVGTPATSTFTVTGANLEGDITVAATGEGFSVAPTTLPAAGGTVTVTYDPAAAGTHTGAITLTSTGAETVSVTLNGTATAPVISGTVTPASLTFSCQEGQTNTATITVENTGNTAFTPVFSGIAAPFSIEAATEIAAGASKQYTVTYAPTAAGTHTGTLTVTINGTATEVTLNGTAEEAPEISDFTVAESESTMATNLSRISPIYGGKFETAGNNAWVQTLYPASLISEQLNGKQITKVRFYHNGTPAFSGGVVEVRIGETDATDLSSQVAQSQLNHIAKTITGIATVFDSNNYMTIEFDEPYPYEGGNLVIQTKVISKGSNQSNSYFFGKYANQLGITSTTLIKTGYSNVGSGNGFQTNFLPMTTFYFENKKGVALVSPEDGVLNFGEVSVKGHKDMTITVKNNNSAAVTPSFSELAYPYSVTDAPESIAAGETATITVTMTPNNDTESVDYNNVPLTLTFGQQTIAITINGTSHVNEPTMTTDEFEEIEYTWTDENGDTHTSNLAEVATDPAQMIALMREVYTNRNVPGNWYRGYTSAGVPDREVIYPAIGTIVYGENGYDYNDKYGWSIGFSDNVTEHILSNDTYNYKYFNPNEYKPLKNGVTLLLVEMNDNNVHEDGTWDEIVASYASESASNPSSYNGLYTMFKTIFKSVRVVTESRRMGAGEDAGTLFKLDADKLNRFFLLAKGRLRQFSLDVDRQPNGFINASSTGNSYRETEEYGPFYQMFEQLSPVDLGNVSAVTDVYQSLVNMQSYAIHHDCQAIPFMNYNNVVGHEFNMYGKASITDDCQDVRDLMITIPERRMQWWYVSGGSDDSRDRTANESAMNDMFINYNKQYVPKMGLFVIKQFPIEGEQQENANVYDLNLSWTSNLLEFLPTGYGVYNLYRVVTNADGTKTYVKVVDNLDPNTFSYVDHIEMKQTGQVVTYVVQGQDQEQFLSLQLSNEESFVIPGLDRKEQLRIALNSDYYFSRYDAATKTNNYSNSIIANNTVGTNVKPNYLENGSQFKFWRATLDNNGEVVTPAEPFVIAEVSGYTQTGGGTLTYKDWKDQTDFSGEKYGHGYHANVTTSTISIENGEVKFDGLKLYDNFRVSVEENTHPALYVYYVTLETAVAFPLNDEGTETSNQATSNTVSVPVYKTGMAMNPISAADVESDVTHQIPAATKFDVNARYSSKSEILGYYIYRWADSETAANERSIYDANGDDASPQGQAGNQGTYYTVAMNTDYTGQTENFAMDANGNHPDVTATFMDNYMVNQAKKGDTYTYAPVVELFAPQQAYEIVNGNNVDREDYNTYGGPQQMTAGAKIKVSVMKADKSPYTWTNDGKTYRYYTVFVNVDSLSLPSGYEVAKVRAWRKIASSYLGEEEDKGYEGRLQLDTNGEFMFDDPATAVVGTLLGGDEQPGSSSQNRIYKGTFGAMDVLTYGDIPMDFVVRVYFTKSVGSAKAADPNGDYYIAEYTVSDKLTSSIPTSIFGVDSYKVVKGVKYYNVAGVESDVPFQGVNIEVTTYDDGSRTSRKVMK